MTGSKKSYWPGYFSTKIITVAHNHFIIRSIMFAVAMAADRVFALCLLMRYKNINYYKHQFMVTIICLILPFISSIGYA